MKIVQLSSENVLRLNAVEITPEGNLIVVGGKNAQGKTSVLDSIFLGLGGRKAKHTEPLKQGKKKGKIIIKTDGDDQLVVTRTFTPKGGALTVTSKGREMASPQTLLDKLTGELTFDPLEFSKSPAKKQLETLKSLVGLDFSELDTDRDHLYMARSEVNREVKRLSAMAESLEDSDVPLTEISVADLTIELTEAMESKALFDKYKADMKHLRELFVQNTSTIEGLHSTIEGLQNQIADLENEQEILKGKGSALKTAIAGIEIVDIEAIRIQIDTAEETNPKIRENQEFADTTKQLRIEEDKSETLTANINAIDEAKALQLTEAKFPIKGLSFDEDGVLFDGVPFAQASSAERLRTSIAMGIALNPDLRVLLIRDGSLLDDDNLKTVAEMASKADAQVWLERVGKGEECSVIIEDGMVYDGGV